MMLMHICDFPKELDFLECKKASDDTFTHLLLATHSGQLSVVHLSNFRGPEATETLLIEAPACSHFS